MLRENYSEGRITLEELQERLDRAYAGKTLGELDTLTADLPAAAAVPPPDAAPPAGVLIRRRIRDVLAYVVVMLFLIAIWAASGHHGTFWPIWAIIIGAFLLAADFLGIGGRHRRRQIDRRHPEVRTHHRRRSANRLPDDIGKE